MDEKKRRILQLLEEGHITAEEAESLIEAIDDQQGKQSTSIPKDEKEQRKKSFQESIRNFTEGLFHIIDDTVQRVKDGPFEFNFNHVNVKRNFEFESLDVSYLNIDFDNGSFQIFPSDDQMIRVEVKGKVYKESNQDQAEKFFDKSLLVEVEQETLHLKQENKNISANTIIYLPKKTYEQAYLKSINGSFTIHQTTINVARISTINGSLKFYNYNGDVLYSETRHGSIKLDEVKVSKIKAETTTGSLYVDGYVEHLDGNVVTGSVRTYIRNLNPKRADLKTTSGSIQLYFTEGTKIYGNANTNVGSIDLNFPNMVVDHLEDQVVKKHFQFHNANESEDYFDVDLRTKTGSIRLSTLGK